MQAMCFLKDRSPAKTALYAAAQEGVAAGALPAYVCREPDHYLDCGLLCRGFAVLQCEDCQERRVVALKAAAAGAYATEAF